MKSPIQKIAQYSALVAGAAAVLPIACKKDADMGDPNITVNNLNLTLQNAPADSQLISDFDIDNDGTKDFELYLSSYAPYYGDFVSKLGSNQVLKFYIDGNNFLRSIPYGQAIADTSVIWGNFGRGSLIDVGKNDGWAGDGDIYSGVRFYIGAELHYGWIRYNVAADGKKITLKDAAYDIRANTPIKAGAK